MKFREFPRVIRSESGSSILLSLIVVIVVLMAYLFTLSRNQSAERQMYMIRYRNQMNAFESRWRTILQQTSSYKNCTFQGTSCQLRSDIVNLNRTLQLTGGGCTPPKHSREQGSANSTATVTCGFSASVTFDQVKRTVALTITPLGIPLKQLDAVIPIPNDILQLSETSCPLIDANKPLFKGIDTSGKAICLPLPKPSCTQPPLAYAVGIDHVSGSIVCRKFPDTSVPIDRCPIDQFVEAFSWEASSTYQPGKITCVPRLNPFSLFIYDPKSAR